MRPLFKISTYLIFCISMISAQRASSTNKNEGTLDAPPETKVVVRLDSLDRYYFPAITSLYKKSDLKIQELIAQGEFGVIERNLVNANGEESSEVRRYKACLNYEAKRSAKDPSGYSLEAIATLCLASKGSTIIGNAMSFMHSLNSKQRPEFIVLTSTVGEINESLDRALPPKNSDGKTVPTRALMGPRFSNSNSLEHFCAQLSSMAYCRTCAKLDKEGTKYVNVVFDPKLLGDLAGIDQKRMKELATTAQTVRMGIEGSFEKLKTLKKMYPNVDIEGIQLFYSPAKDSEKESRDFNLCLPCKGKVDKDGACIENGCDVSSTFAHIHTSAVSKCQESCTQGKVLIDGICSNNCTTWCNLVEKEHYDRLVLLERKSKGIKRADIKELVHKKLQNFKELLIGYTQYRDQCKSNEEKFACDKINRKLESLEAEIIYLSANSDSCATPLLGTPYGCFPRDCQPCVLSVEYLSTESSVMACGTAVFRYARDLLRNRWHSNISLLRDQCQTSPGTSIGQLCERLRDPTDVDAFEILRQNGIACNQSQGSSNGQGVTAE